jgi:hypothetical protein
MKHIPLLTGILLAPVADLHAAEASKSKPNMIIHFIDDL